MCFPKVRISEEDPGQGVCACVLSQVKESEANPAVRSLWNAKLGYCYIHSAKLRINAEAAHYAVSTPGWSVEDKRSYLRFLRLTIVLTDRPPPWLSFYHSKYSESVDLPFILGVLPTFQVFPKSLAPSYRNRNHLRRKCNPAIPQPHRYKRPAPQWVLRLTTSSKVTVGRS